jgi:Right handed beta helix region
VRSWGAGVAVLAAGLVLTLAGPDGRVVQLPPGVVELHSEMVVEKGTQVIGAASGSVLRAAADFHGRALVVVRGDGVGLRGFAVDGNRGALEVRAGLPGYDVPFARFTANNGVLAEGVSGLAIQGVEFREIAGFAILVSRSRGVAIDRVRIVNSGSRNAAGHNNTTGGILLEEGSADFRVTRCELRNVLGNGIWTHSLYTSARNARGVFQENRLETIGRDALQAGHATEMRIEGNVGTRIGYPEEAVDATPVGIDTAGNVERSIYSRNQFSDINGKCVDLDGFHDGEVRDNVCTGIGGYGVVMNNTNPDMQSSRVRIEGNLLENVKYGGIFVIGTDNAILRNRLLNVNTAHCGCPFTPGEPDMFRSGIYLGKGAARPAPARGNLVEGNEISGYEMPARCIGGAPTIYPNWNTIRGNRCW